MRPAAWPRGIAEVLLAITLAAGVLGPTPTRAADPTSGLTSPMVDASVFRDGQIERRTGAFGGWTVVCDEVKALGRRFCSLRSTATTATGGAKIVVDLSTGDDGKPAGLLHLPNGISIQPGVGVARARKTDGARAVGHANFQATPSRRIPIATCSALECLSVWSLSLDDIASLNRGQDQHFVVCALPPSLTQFQPDLGNRTCIVRVEFVLPGRGFRDAVLASTT